MNVIFSQSGITLEEQPDTGRLFLSCPELEIEREEIPFAVARVLAWSQLFTRSGVDLLNRIALAREDSL